MSSSAAQCAGHMPADPTRARSARTLDGPSRAPARAMFKAIGLTDEDLRRPIVGIANTWTELGPCNYHLRELAGYVKAGVRAAGGTPLEFGTIAISDGISMGTEGMRASLVSREVIADSIELVARGHALDAVVVLVGCDKTIPAAVMALARLDIPGVVLYGGAIAPGSRRRSGRHDPGRLRGGGRARAPAGWTTRGCRRSRTARVPGPERAAASSPRTPWRWRCEFLGISPMGSASVPAASRQHAPTSRRVRARWSWRALARDLRPAPDHHAGRPSRTPSPAWPRRADRPTPCCTCSRSRARRAWRSAIDDFDAISRRTPLLADLKPGGRYTVVDLYAAGGTAAGRLAPASRRACCTPMPSR